MKRDLGLLLLLLAHPVLLFAQETKPLFPINLTGGINIAKHYSELNGIKVPAPYLLYSPHIGSAFLISVSDNFYFQPNLAYTIKGFRFKNTSQQSVTIGRQHMHYIEFSAYGLYLIKDFFEVYAGPYAGYLLGFHTKHTEYNNNGGKRILVKGWGTPGFYKHFDYGFYAGAGLRWSNGMVTTLGFSRGFRQLNNFNTEQKRFNQLFKATVEYPLRNIFSKKSPREERVRSSAKDTIKRNAFYIELLGNGGFYSVNYDRIILHRKIKVSLRIGASYVPPKTLSGRTLPEYWLPVSINTFWGKKHHVEAAIGHTFWANSQFSLPATETPSSYKLWATSFWGYRFQPPEGGMVFRIGYTPRVNYTTIVYLDKYNWWRYLSWEFISAGISVGYSF